MKPKILLIGTTGQVGRDLSRMLPNVGELTSLDRQGLDLTNPEEIRSAIRAHKPEVIVNAAAYTAVDKAESEESIARAVNAEAPAVMAEEAKKIGAFLIHYSTDYVFDGQKTSPYSEADPTNPQNVYGRTKLEGERAIPATGASHLIFRTAWVYATQGRNFLLTILRLATQRTELRIVGDQVGAPTTSREIARGTTDILRQIAEAGKSQRDAGEISGIYHMTAAGSTSWCEFANAILDEAANSSADIAWLAAATNKLPLLVRRATPIATAEYPTPARRPAYSVLSNARLARSFSVQLPDWRDQLHSLFTARYS